MKHRALVIEQDPQVIEQIEDVLAALSHDYDLAACLLQARKLLETNQYSYILSAVEFPARSARGTARIQNLENLLDDLADRDGETPPVIILSDQEAQGLDETEDLMRLAMSLERKGAADLIKKPFPTAGRSLDRMIKKVLGLHAVAGQKQGESRVEAGGTGDPDAKDDPEPGPLTQVQRDVLEALAGSRHETMLLADVGEASGYSKYATRKALKRLRSLGLASRPQGQRKGDAITAKGKALLGELSAWPGGPA